MKIKNLYTYGGKKQIWRLIPTDSIKLVIEERDTESKEVFFSCIEIESGKNVIKNLQFEEKFWIGIESIYNDIIFFHKFAKPDMPGHAGIIAYDLNSGDILWTKDDLAFLFLYEEKVYCFTSKFEGKDFFTLDYKTGELVEELGDNAQQINILRSKSISNVSYRNYIFPEVYKQTEVDDKTINNIFNRVKEEKVITGSIEYAKKGDFLLFNYHTVENDGTLKNIFNVIDTLSEKSIFEVTLNKKLKVFVPDSFFMLDDFLFLLLEKTKLMVCKIHK